MINIKLFRENPEKIKKSERMRFKDPSVVDEVVRYDSLWKETQNRADSLKVKRKKLTNKISKLKKEKKSAEAEIEEMKSVNKEISELDLKANDYLKKRDRFRSLIGAILHESVPIGKTEDSDEVIRVVGEKPLFAFEPKTHADLIELVNGADVSKAAEVVGARFYYLMNDLVLLNLSLMRFALDLLQEKGYQLMWTPFLLNSEAMRGVAEIDDFAQQLYKIDGDDLFLIATSEQTLASFHKNELIEEDRLPLKYAGVSTCFRKEADAQGKDTKGIFRVHQFEKIEQYVFCTPEQSWNLHEEMIGNAEALFKKLGIHYRVVNIASGDLKDSAAKRYDLEAWFPAQEKYRELVSASNCVDYQSKRLNVRYGRQGVFEEVAHSLNSTAIATERTICCILENYQQEDGGIKIPKALQPYMDEKKCIR